MQDTGSSMRSRGAHPVRQGRPRSHVAMVSVGFVRSVNACEGCESTLSGTKWTGRLSTKYSEIPASRVTDVTGRFVT